MKSNAICPHCNHEFDTHRSFMDALNVECGISSAGKPEAVINGWSVFFRGWIDSANSLDIRGFCLAAKSNSLMMYYCEAGTDIVNELPRGHGMTGRPTVYFDPQMNSREELVKAARQSMESLKAFIGQLKA